MFYSILVDGRGSRFPCQHALRIGCRILCRLTQQSLRRAVEQVTNSNGVTAAFIVAGSVQADKASLDSLGPFETLICIRIPPPTDIVQFHPLQSIDIRFRIIGSVVGTRADVLEALSFVSRGAVVPVVQTQKLKDLNEIYQNITTGQVRETPA